MINARLKNNKQQENSKMSQKPMHVYLIKIKERNMILGELISMEVEALIWEISLASQGLLIWVEWEEMKELIDSQPTWEGLV